MTRTSMDRFIDTIEWIAAGFVGIVAANIFIAVLLRNIFNYAIPDSFDIGRLVLGILIFWGIAHAWALFDKVRGPYNDKVTTFDMHLPTWPFFAVAWAGDVSAVLLIAIRTWRLIFHPEDLRSGEPLAKAVE